MIWYGMNGADEQWMGKLNNTDDPTLFTPAPAINCPFNVRTAPFHTQLYHTLIDSPIPQMQRREQKKKRVNACVRVMHLLNCFNIYWIDSHKMLHNVARLRMPVRECEFISHPFIAIGMVKILVSAAAQKLWNAAAIFCFRENNSNKSIVRTNEWNGKRKKKTFIQQIISALGARVVCAPRCRRRAHFSFNCFSLNLIRSSP